MPSSSARVVIVGAGTAGLHAAFELAQAGVASLVIDASPRIGGAVYRDPARRGCNRDFLSSKIKQATEELYARLREHAGLIELRLATEVLGPMGNRRQLAVLTGQKSFATIDYDRLIVCTGCYERATPFPGWTLPGVMLLGGAQLQIKGGMVRPGKRMVICGSGPLVPVAALQLHRAGVEIAALCEANHLRSFIKRAGAILDNIPLFAEGLSVLARLHTADVKMRYGWGIVEARGKERVEEVVIAPYDRQWRPDLTRQKVVQADCLATGYGFVPRSELTRLLGVNSQLNVAGDPVPVADNACRTSIDRVYVAGDAVDAQGGQIAVLTGSLAAVSCLEDMQKISARESRQHLRRYRRRIRKLQGFIRLFPDFVRPRQGQMELVQADTVICRCENVTRGDLDIALHQGIVDLTTLKMATRAGMGDCQAKMCGPFCRSYLNWKLGTKEIGELRPRFPLTPVPFGAMLTTQK